MQNDMLIGRQRVTTKRIMRALIASFVASALCVSAVSLSAQTIETMKPITSREIGQVVVSSYAYTGPAIGWVRKAAKLDASRQKAKDVLDGLIFSCIIPCDGLTPEQRNRQAKPRTYLAIHRKDGKRVEVSWTQARRHLRKFCKAEGKTAQVSNRPTREGEALFYEGQCQ